MSIEKVGPGSIGNSYGTRNPKQISGLPKERLDWFKEPLSLLSAVTIGNAMTTAVTNPTITAGGALRAWDSGAFTFPAGNAKMAGTNYPDYLGCRHMNITSPNVIQNIVAEFQFFGQAFEIFGKKTSAACNVRVLVDGVAFRSITPYAPTGASGDLIYILCDFGSFAGRTIRLEMDYFYFNGVQCLDTCSVQPVDYSSYPLVIGIGDSFEEGTGAAFTFDGFMTQAARRIGLKKYWSSGLGSTGYIAKTTDKKTYGERLYSDVIAYNPNIVFVSGSVNDVGLSPLAVAQAASDLYSQIKIYLPTAQIIVGGVWAVNTPSQAALDVNKALKDVCAKAAIPFIDPLTGPTPWVTASMAWARAGDQAHPSVEGHKHFQNQVVNSIRNLIK